MAIMPSCSDQHAHAHEHSKVTVKSHSCCTFSCARGGGGAHLDVQAILD
jgi:hypothetical protein